MLSDYKRNQRSNMEMMSLRAQEIGDDDVRELVPEVGIGEWMAFEILEWFIIYPHFKFYVLISCGG